MDSTSAEELDSTCTRQQNTAELSGRDMSLLSSMHRALFIQLTSCNWFHGDKTLLPKVNVIWPYLVGYRTAAVIVRHCAHVLGKVMHLYFTSCCVNFYSDDFCELWCSCPIRLHYRSCPSLSRLPVGVRSLCPV